MSLWDDIFKPKQPGYAASQHPVAPKPKGSMWDPVKANIPATPGPTAGNYTFPATPNASTGYKHGSKPSSSNVGSGGPSGGAQASAPVAPAFNAATMLPDPRNDLNPIYDAAMKRIMDMNSGLQGDFDKAIAATQAQYASSNSDLYNRYQGARADLDASAAGLGVQGDQVYKDYDPSLRRIQENSDSQRNASVDLLRTLQTLRQQQGVDVQASLEQQRAKALAEQTAQWVEAISAMQAAATGGSSSGGGGGGRSRGRSGGSSSGSVSENAQQTQTAYDPEFYAQYLALRAIDPDAANIAMETYLGTQSSPSVKAITEGIGQTSLDLKTNKYSSWDNLFGNQKVNNLKNNPFVAAPGAAQKEKERQAKNKANAKKLRDQQKARGLLISGASGSLGNASTQNKVTVKAK